MELNLYMWAGGSFICGIFLCYIINEFRIQSLLAEQKSEIARHSTSLEERLNSCQRELAKTEEVLSKSDRRLEELLNEKGDLRERISELETRLEEERRSGEDKIRNLNEARQQLKLEFRQLADRIFAQNSETFATQNKEKLDAVLNPLKEQIGNFRKKVEETYEKETRERHSLKNEILNLQKLNTRMSDEALNLTRALKGDTRSQGAWGEVVLERILETAGLQKDREYFVQECHRDNEGRLYRPDVIVQLPDERDIVIDSKVSLLAYERFCSEDDLELRPALSKQHAESVRTHLRSLSEKSYQTLPGVRTLDYVLMFLPLEGAFRLAVEEDAALLTEALQKNVLIVSPSTLLCSLRTIHRLWQFDNQNKHARAIARKADQLHSQFVQFLKELEKVGNSIGIAGRQYDIAFKRLGSGRNNILRLTSELEEMGLTTGEKIPAHIAMSFDDINE